MEIVASLMHDMKPKSEDCHFSSMKNQCERKSICFETLRLDVECFVRGVRMSKALNHLRAFVFPSRLKRNVLHMIPEKGKIHSEVDEVGMTVRSFETKTTSEISSSLDLVRWWKLSFCSVNYSMEKRIESVSGVVFYSGPISSSTLAVCI